MRDAKKAGFDGKDLGSDYRAICIYYAERGLFVKTYPPPDWFYDIAAARALREIGFDVTPAEVHKVPLPWIERAMIYTETWNRLQAGEFDPNDTCSTPR